MCQKRGLLFAWFLLISCVYAAELSVSSPGSGDRFVAGQTVLISWDFSGIDNSNLFNNVEIRIMEELLLVDREVASVKQWLNGNYVWPTLSQRSVYWTVPDCIAPNSNIYVELTCVDCDTYVGGLIRKDVVSYGSTFVADPAQIVEYVTPHAETVWTPGVKLPIVWRTNADGEIRYPAFTLEEDRFFGSTRPLSCSRDCDPVSALASFPPMDGVDVNDVAFDADVVCVWCHVPDDVRTSSAYSIHGETVCRDDESALFDLLSVAVETPTRSTVWQAEADYEVSWRYHVEEANKRVRVYLRRVESFIFDWLKPDFELELSGGWTHNDGHLTGILPSYDVLPSSDAYYVEVELEGVEGRSAGRLFSITAMSVTSPTKETSWSVFDSVTVTWRRPESEANRFDVSVLICRDPSNVFEHLRSLFWGLSECVPTATDVSNSGTASFIVPDLPTGDSYFIAIQTADMAAESERFSIASNRVTSPTEGSILESFGPIRVEWLTNAEETAAGGVVTIRLCRRKSAVFDYLPGWVFGSDTCERLAGPIANHGVWVGILPDVPTSDSYTLVVDNGGLGAESEPFTVLASRVISPTGGDTLNSPGPIIIEWSAHPVDRREHVRVELCRTESSMFSFLPVWYFRKSCVVLADNVADSGSLQTTLPAGLETSDSYTVAVEANGFHVTSEPFSIASAVVITPASNTLYSPGESLEVTWTSQHDPALGRLQVQVLLCRHVSDVSALWRLSAWEWKRGQCQALGTAFAETGSLIAKVPSVATSDRYYIALQFGGPGGVVAEGHDFTISSLSPQLLVEETDLVNVGDAFVVQWEVSSEDARLPIDLYLCRDGQDAGPFAHVPPMSLSASENAPCMLLQSSLPNSGSWSSTLETVVPSFGSDAVLPTSRGYYVVMSVSDAIDIPELQSESTRFGVVAWDVASPTSIDVLAVGQTISVEWDTHSQDAGGHVELFLCRGPSDRFAETTEWAMSASVSSEVVDCPLLGKFPNTGAEKITVPEAATSDAYRVVVSSVYESGFARVWTESPQFTLIGVTAGVESVIYNVDSPLSVTLTYTATDASVLGGSPVFLCRYPTPAFSYLPEMSVNGASCVVVGGVSDSDVALPSGTQHESVVTSTDVTCSIPASVATADGYYVVLYLDDRLAVSSPTFAVRYHLIEAPLGEETMLVGSTLEVRWAAHPDQMWDTADVALCNGQLQCDRLGSQLVNRGSLSAKVPSTVSSDDYTIQVVLGEIPSRSDPFAIMSEAVVAPTEGSTLTSGSALVVEWTGYSGSESAKVHMDLCRNPSTAFSHLPHGDESCTRLTSSDGTANNGRFDAYVPSVATSDAYVVVLSHDGVERLRSQSAPFSVIPPEVSLSLLDNFPGYTDTSLPPLAHVRIEWDVSEPAEHAGVVSLELCRDDSKFFGWLFPLIRGVDCEFLATVPNTGLWEGQFPFVPASDSYTVSVTFGVSSLHVATSHFTVADLSVIQPTRHDVFDVFDPLEISWLGESTTDEDLVTLTQVLLCRELSPLFSWLPQLFWTNEECWSLHPDQDALVDSQTLQTYVPDVPTSDAYYVTVSSATVSRKLWSPSGEIPSWDAIRVQAVAIASSSEMFSVQGNVVTNPAKGESYAAYETVELDWRYHPEESHISVSVELCRQASRLFPGPREWLFRRDECVLVEDDVPNTGSASVVLPNVDTSDAYYFVINNHGLGAESQTFAIVGAAVHSPVAGVELVTLSPLTVQWDAHPDEASLIVDLRLCRRRSHLYEGLVPWAWREGQCEVLAAAVPNSGAHSVTIPPVSSADSYYVAVLYAADTRWGKLALESAEFAVVGTSVEVITPAYNSQFVVLDTVDVTWTTDDGTADATLDIYLCRETSRLFPLLPARKGDECLLMVEGAPNSGAALVTIPQVETSDSYYMMLAHPGSSLELSRSRQISVFEAIVMTPSASVQVLALSEGVVSWVPEGATGVDSLSIFLCREEAVGVLPGWFFSRDECELLGENVPNTGSAAVWWPDVPTSDKYRILLEAFGMSVESSNFAIISNSISSPAEGDTLTILDSLDVMWRAHPEATQQMVTLQLCRKPSRIFDHLVSWFWKDGDCQPLNPVGTPAGLDAAVPIPNLGNATVVVPAVETSEQYYVTLENGGLGADSGVFSVVGLVVTEPSADDVFDAGTDVAVTWTAVGADTTQVLTVEVCRENPRLIGSLFEKWECSPIASGVPNTGSFMARLPADLLSDYYFFVLYTPAGRSAELVGQSSKFAARAMRVTLPDHNTVWTSLSGPVDVRWSGRTDEATTVSVYLCRRDTFFLRPWRVEEGECVSLASEIANTGSHQVTRVPNVAQSGSYYVTVLPDGDISDTMAFSAESDEFLVEGAQWEVTSPTRGSSSAAGRSVVIEWLVASDATSNDGSVPGNSYRVDVELCRGPSSIFHYLRPKNWFEGDECVPLGSAPLDLAGDGRGVYEAVLPSVETSDRYYVVVKDAQFGAESSYFSVAGSVVSSPAAGDLLTVFEPMGVVWNVHSGEDAFCASLQLCRQPSGVFSRLPPLQFLLEECVSLGTGLPNTGRAEVLIPDVETSDAYQVVVSLDSEVVLGAESDLFSIVGASVTTPAAGDVLHAYADAIVAWHADPSLAEIPVSIQLCRHPSRLFEWLLPKYWREGDCVLAAEDVPNSGLATVILPAVESSDAYTFAVMFSDEVAAESERFSIVGSQVTSPSAGDTLYSLQQTTITWTTGPAEDAATVTIGLCRQPSLIFGYLRPKYWFSDECVTLAGSVPNMGSASVVLPEMATGDTYYAVVENTGLAAESSLFRVVGSVISEPAENAEYTAYDPLTVRWGVHPEETDSLVSLRICRRESRIFSHVLPWQWRRDECVVLAAAVPNTGEFITYVPSVSTFDAYYVAVTYVEGEEGIAAESSNFAILGNKVTSPEAGATVTAFEDVTLEWRVHPDDMARAVKINLCRHPSTLFDYLNPRLWRDGECSLLEENVENVGAATVRIPGVATSDAYTIVVSDETLGAESDRFTVLSAHIFTPAEGATLTHGETTLLEWHADVEERHLTLELHLCRSPSLVFGYLRPKYWGDGDCEAVQKNIRNSGSAEISVPHAETGDSYYFTLRAMSWRSDVIVESATFSLIGATVTEPAGDTVYQVFDPMSVRWTVQPSEASLLVDLELCRAFSERFSGLKLFRWLFDECVPLASSLPNSGVADVVVPDVATSDAYYVALRPHAEARELTAESQLFSVSANTLLGPCDGCVLFAEEEMTVTWRVHPDEDEEHVRLELCREKTSLFDFLRPFKWHSENSECFVLADEVPNTGYANVSVPIAATSDGYYVVLVNGGLGAEGPRFTVVGTVVSAPAGGDVYTHGDIIDVKWTIAEIEEEEEAVDVLLCRYQSELFRASPLEWSSDDGDHSCISLASAYGNSGSLRTVLPVVQTSDSYYVVVAAASGVGSPSEPFMILGTRVLTPSGGEMLRAGEAADIVWESHYSEGQGSISAMLCLEESANFAIDASSCTTLSLPADTTARLGRVQVTIPAHVKTSDAYYVALLNSATPAAPAYRSAEFGVSAVDVVTPKAAAVWVAGQTAEVVWQSSDEDEIETKVRLCRYASSQFPEVSPLHLANCPDLEIISSSARRLTNGVIETTALVSVALVATSDSYVVVVGSDNSGLMTLSEKFWVHSIVAIESRQYAYYSDDELQLSWFVAPEQSKLGPTYVYLCRGDSDYFTYNPIWSPPATGDAPDDTDCVIASTFDRNPGSAVVKVPNVATSNTYYVAVGATAGDGIVRSVALSPPLSIVGLSVEAPEPTAASDVAVFGEVSVRWHATRDDAEHRLSTRVLLCRRDEEEQKAMRWEQNECLHLTAVETVDGSMETRVRIPAVAPANTYTLAVAYYVTCSRCDRGDYALLLAAESDPFAVITPLFVEPNLLSHWAPGSIQRVVWLPSNSEVSPESADSPFEICSMAETEVEETTYESETTTTCWPLDLASAAAFTSNPTEGVNYGNSMVSSSSVVESGEIMVRVPDDVETGKSYFVRWTTVGGGETKSASFSMVDDSCTESSCSDGRQCLLTDDGHLCGPCPHGLLEHLDGTCVEAQEVAITGVASGALFTAGDDSVEPQLTWSSQDFSEETVKVELVTGGRIFFSGEIPNTGTLTLSALTNLKGQLSVSARVSGTTPVDSGAKRTTSDSHVAAGWSEAFYVVGHYDPHTTLPVEDDSDDSPILPTEGDSDPSVASMSSSSNDMSWLVKACIAAGAGAGCLLVVGAQVKKRQRRQRSQRIGYESIPGDDMDNDVDELSPASILEEGAALLRGSISVIGDDDDGNHYHELP